MKNIKSILCFFLLFFIWISNCQNLDKIPTSPNTTPEMFLLNQHWLKVDLGQTNFILSQPSSSFLVYFLGFFYLYLGFQFWKDRFNHKSKYWWAIGFYLTGFAAILAGTSYQALGYELKCSGREFCRWTTWWEINYEIFQNAGMNGFLIATAYSNTTGKLRKFLFSYAIFNAISYTVMVIFGAVFPIQFLVSFEFLELSCLPSILFFLWISIIGYFREKDRMNLYLRNTWILFLFVIIAYIVYMDFGVTNFLWSKGIWFTENDVLHVGLIFWVYYILINLTPFVTDFSKEKLSLK
jgi:hypothetical protein